jgi:DNA-3-methyladenine glycosylase
MKIDQGKKLGQAFYSRDTVVVARELIGHVLVRKIGNMQLAGIITETEAYRGDDDPACHAYRGKTARTAPLFGNPGSAYIYLIYGNHYCFNIVSKSSHQTSGGVLIRAIQPIEGIEIMQQWRGNIDLKNIANGPGKLTQALQITKAHNFLDCTQSEELYVLRNKTSYEIMQTPRIGISKAQDKLWRFVAQH